MKKWLKVSIISLSVILAIAISLAGALLILNQIGMNEFHKNDANIDADSVDIEDDTTVSYNGKLYALNKNVVSVLFIGLDKKHINDNLGYGANGQADCIFLASIDTKNKKTTIIPISRETMVDVNLYTVEGTYAGVKHEQLCLAYAYGKTPEDCSMNVITSVKRILLGINISSYIAVDMKGIGSFTETLGGIELNSLEDILLDGKEIKSGSKLKLSGQAAIDYIRTRGQDLAANERRMLRQKQFLTALVNKTGNEIIGNYSKIGSYYNTLSPYISTNVTLSQITYIASTCLKPNAGSAIEYKIIEGELTMGEEWVEFVPNEESVIRIILETFYNELPSENEE